MVIKAESGGGGVGEVEEARVLENPFEGSKKVNCRYCMAEWYTPRDRTSFKCPICGNTTTTT